MSRSEHIRRIVALVAIVVATRFAIMARMVAPARDTVRFVHIAQRLEREPWRQVIREERQHVAYPMTVAATEWLLRDVGPWTGPELWWVAARVVSVFSALVLVVPLYGLCMELFDPRVAWWGTFAFVLLPVPAQITADGLSDSLHLLCFTSGAWAAVRSLNRQGPAWLVVVGLATGVGYWTRPEALVLPAALAAVLMITQCSAAWRWRWREAGLGVTGLAAGVALLVLPYLSMKEGRLSDKNAFRLMLGLPLVPRAERPAADRNDSAGARTERMQSRPAETRTPIQDVSRWGAPQPNSLAPCGESELIFDCSLDRVLSVLPALVLLEAGPDAAAPLPQRGISTDRSLLAATREIAHELVVACHCYWLFFGLLALFVPWGPTARKPSAYLPAAIVAIFLCVLVRLYQVAGYVADRHTLLVLVALVPSIGRGLVLWIDLCVVAVKWLAGRRSFVLAESGVRRGIAVLMIVAVGAGCLPKMLRPQHAGAWGLRQAGYWLAEHSGPDSAVLDVRGVAAFFGERKRYDHGMIDEARLDPKLRYVVVQSSDLVDSDHVSRSLQGLVSDATLVASFSAFEGRSEPAVFVFKRDGLPAAQP